MTAPHTLAKSQSGAEGSGHKISTSAALLKWVYVGRLSVAGYPTLLPSVADSLAELVESAGLLCDLPGDPVDG